MAFLRITPVEGGLEQIAPDDRAAALALLAPPPVPAPTLRPRGRGPAAAQVRRWAHDAGVPCPPSGPIPRAVLTQFQSAR